MSNHNHHQFPATSGQYNATGTVNDQAIRRKRPLPHVQPASFVGHSDNDDALSVSSSSSSSQLSASAFPEDEDIVMIDCDDAAPIPQAKRPRIDQLSATSSSVHASSGIDTRLPAQIPSHNLLSRSGTDYVIMFEGDPLEYWHSSIQFQGEQPKQKEPSTPSSQRRSRVSKKQLIQQLATPLRDLVRDTAPAMKRQGETQTPRVPPRRRTILSHAANAASQILKTTNGTIEKLDAFIGYHNKDKRLDGSPLYAEPQEFPA